MLMLMLMLVLPCNMLIQNTLNRSLVYLKEYAAVAASVQLREKSSITASNISSGESEKNEAESIRISASLRRTTAHSLILSLSTRGLHTEQGFDAV
jgi:hypothetical protein